MKPLAILVCISLTSCAGIPLGISAAGGAITIANEAVSLTSNSLSLAAKLACALQAEANVEGNARLSRTAGSYCVW